MSTPDPGINDATRTAVLDAECERLGHIYLFENMLRSGQNGGSTDTIGAQDPSQIAHIVCRRCGKVWLVLESTPGCCYDHAVARLADSLNDTCFITPCPRPENPGITAPADHDREHE